jgi:hypothetical protein
MTSALSINRVCMCLHVNSSELLILTFHGGSFLCRFCFWAFEPRGCGKFCDISELHAAPNLREEFGIRVGLYMGFGPTESRQSQQNQWTGKCYQIILFSTSESTKILWETLVPIGHTSCFLSTLAVTACEHGY